MSLIASTSCSESVPSSAVGVPSRVISRSISSSSRPGPRGRLGQVDRRLAAAGQQVLDVAEGEPPVADRPAQLLERVAALAHPRHHPGLGRGGRRPAVVADRDHLRLRPALQRRRRDPRDPGGLAERDRSLGHGRRSYGGARELVCDPVGFRPRRRRRRGVAPSPCGLHGPLRRPSAPGAPCGPLTRVPVAEGLGWRGPLLACCRLGCSRDYADPFAASTGASAALALGRQRRVLGLDHTAVGLGDQPRRRQVEQRGPRVAAGS